MELDIGWPDCFNSGVFVTKPSLELYRLLTEHALTHGSFDGLLLIGIMARRRSRIIKFIF